MIRSNKPTLFSCKKAILGTAVLLSSFSTHIAADEAGIHRAVVTIPNPRSANLLQLRGLGGKGSAFIQIGNKCHLMPVRLVAGDLAGESIRVRRNAPIVIEIHDTKTVNALLNGADIVSDEGNGLKIISGLMDDTGFVINPGRNIAADVLGTRVTETSCDAGEARPAPQKGD